MANHRTKVADLQGHQSVGALSPLNGTIANAPRLLHECAAIPAALGRSLVKSSTGQILSTGVLSVRLQGTVLTSARD